MSKAPNLSIAAFVYRMASFRVAGIGIALATPLLGPILIAAEEQLNPPSETRYERAPIASPVGHRQPRATDIPQNAKTAADLLDARETAVLNRKLVICRGC